MRYNLTEETKKRLFSLNDAEFAAWVLGQLANSFLQFVLTSLVAQDRVVIMTGFKPCLLRKQ